MPDRSRLHPSRPVLAASVAVVRDGLVLLAARGRPPMRGAFTFPGGGVEVGETLAEAARREVMEETGLAIGDLSFLMHREAIVRGDDGRVVQHFVICVFTAPWIGGEPTVTEEATEFLWVDPRARSDIVVTPGLWDVLASIARPRG